MENIMLPCKNSGSSQTSSNFSGHATANTRSYHKWWYIMQDEPQSFMTHVLMNLC